MTVTVFDAYGTLFDPYALTERLEAAFPGRGTAISAAWRDAQLRYTWLRSLMDRWAPFDLVTRDALSYACRLHDAQPDGELVDELMSRYLRLPAYADVGDLHAISGKLAILSNGTRRMLAATVEAAGLGGVFAAVLSSDEVEVYKPDPRIYRLALDRFTSEPGAIRFVSANAWDCAGAAAFGFEVVRLDRRGEPPEELGVVSPRVIATLAALAA